MQFQGLFQARNKGGIRRRTFSGSLPRSETRWKTRVSSPAIDTAPPRRLGDSPSYPACGRKPDPVANGYRAPPPFASLSCTDRHQTGPGAGPSVSRSSRPRRGDHHSVRNWQTRRKRPATPSLRPAGKLAMRRWLKLSARQTTKAVANGQGKQRSLTSRDYRWKA